MKREDRQINDVMWGRRTLRLSPAERQVSSGSATQVEIDMEGQQTCSS